MRGRRCRLLQLLIRERRLFITDAKIPETKCFAKRDQAHIPRGSAVTGEFRIRREPGRKMRLKAHSQQHDLQKKQTKPSLSDKDTEKTSAAPKVFESHIIVVTLPSLQSFMTIARLPPCRKRPKKRDSGCQISSPSTSILKHLCACNCVEAEEVVLCTQHPC